jgi:hypothetical protein
MIRGTIFLGSVIGMMMGGAALAAPQLQPLQFAERDACMTQCRTQCDPSVSDDVCGASCTAECGPASTYPSTTDDGMLFGDDTARERSSPPANAAESETDVVPGASGTTPGSAGSTGSMGTGSTGSTGSGSSSATTDSTWPASGSADAAPAQRSAAEQAGINAEEERRIRADERERSGDVIQDALLTPTGVYAFLGGGATNFTQPEAVGATNVGGYWDARVGIGSRSIIGAEVAYVGSSRSIQALGLSDDAFLLGNGVEGVARLNVPITVDTFLFEPYTFGGVGWQRYNLITDGANTSSLSSTDDILAIPLGIGMSLGVSGLTFDARATYRHALGSDLFGTQTSSFDDASMNSWGAGGSVGFEF